MKSGDLWGKKMKKVEEKFLEFFLKKVEVLCFAKLSFLVLFLARALSQLCSCFIVEWKIKSFNLDV